MCRILWTTLNVVLYTTNNGLLVQKIIYVKHNCYTMYLDCLTALLQYLYFFTRIVAHPPPIVRHNIQSNQYTVKTDL